MRWEDFSDAESWEPHAVRTYIIYDVDLVPNLERRGYCDIVRTIDILYVSYND